MEVKNVEAIRIGTVAGHPLIAYSLSTRSYVVRPAIMQGSPCANPAGRNCRFSLGSRPFRSDRGKSVPGPGEPRSKGSRRSPFPSVGRCLDSAFHGHRLGSEPSRCGRTCFALSECLVDGTRLQATEGGLRSLQDAAPAQPLDRCRADAESVREVGVAERAVVVPLVRPQQASGRNPAPGGPRAGRPPVWSMIA